MPKLYPRLVSVLESDWPYAYSAWKRIHDARQERAERQTLFTFTDVNAVTVDPDPDPDPGALLLCLLMCITFTYVVLQFPSYV